MKGIEGTTLGRYELRRRVAHGGMSEVYLGYDRHVRRLVAVKVLYGSDEPFVRRFEHEAMAVGTLSHDHILPLYDFGEQRPWYYLVMPYIEGGTLRDYLAKRGMLTLEEAGSFISQIASALEHAHDHSVVHRDVKPSNILLRPDGYAYLVDFGLAKAKMASQSLSLPHSESIVGTPEYMAPEQSNGINDYRSDIYSLGIILYQMLTGQVPFMAESLVAVTIKHIQMPPTPPSQLNKDIPLSVEKVVLKSLAKDPADRYQNAIGFAEAYQEALTKERRTPFVLTSSSLPIPGNSFTSVESGVDVIQKPSTVPVITQVRYPLEKSFMPATTLPRVFPLEQKTSFFQHHTSLAKKRQRPLIIALCSALLLMIVGFTIWWWPGQPQVTKIAHQQGQATPNPLHAAQTATAHGLSNQESTRANQARAQASAGITSGLINGPQIYANTLTKPGDGWLNDGSQCYFSPNGYHIFTAHTHSFAWCFSNQKNFGEISIAVQAQIVHGDTYGLIFRLNAVQKSFYVLEVNSSGDYRFVHAQGNNPQSWLTLIDWTHSVTIKPGYGQNNDFLIQSTKSYTRFYVNKQLLTSSVPGGVFQDGYLGFLVGGDKEGGTEAIFHNLWVFDNHAS